MARPPLFDYISIEDILRLGLTGETSMTDNVISLAEGRKRLADKLARELDLKKFETLPNFWPTPEMVLMGMLMVTVPTYCLYCLGYEVLTEWGK